MVQKETVLMIPRTKKKCTKKKTGRARFARPTCLSLGNIYESSYLLLLLLLNYCFESLLLLNYCSEKLLLREE